MKTLHKAYLAILFIAFAFSPNAFAKNNLAVYTGDSVHISLGVPKDSDPSNDYFILRKQYALSYNHETGTPNWVSYELTADWFGNVPRYKGNFITDTSLPAEFYRVKHSDYTNTGFDRGHLVRSEERTKTAEDNKSTFLLTNIMPQTPDLNRGPWLGFEYYCEKLCKKENKRLFIITGPIFPLDKECCHIDKYNTVARPKSCFKIAVILEKNQNINHIDAKTKVIAVIMPNESGIRKENWEQYRTTVRAIEQETGYNFLSNLPQKLQDILENKID